ncbi:hypothetical protein [Actinophytocola gossypii]|uniref:DUF485 domain-containing protein n=1 Tax=Actinophytocola gossypii TaxID=2812003 RepID=A0ABT2JGP6_9PSEU|nr:hypothetical protein [Actinophytocola gossypii]MCT2586600.1 hypothetical protein [Actinophytocola gossypii]
MNRHAAGPPGRDGREPGKPYRDPPTAPRRKRVVLADSRAPVTVLRTVVELEEQTSYGEALVTNFIRSQLKWSVLLGGIVLAYLAALPALFYFVPALTDVSVAGVPLPWLLVGVAPFPLLFGVAYWYNSKAERQEQAFVALVEK